MIIQNRPHNGEDVGDITDVNDVRNGVFVYSTVHVSLDRRRAVILKVC
jgi:hypothetical protein